VKHLTCASKAAMLMGLTALTINACVQPPDSTRAERAEADSAARAEMKAGMDRCEQARQQMQQPGSMRAPTSEMTEDMQQCDPKMPGFKPTGLHL
jgi:hypothetical protein